MELAGRRAPTLQLLLDEKALDPNGTARFIGVDHDAKIIRECEKHYASAPATWVNNDIGALLKRRNDHADVGVLVFDSEYEIGKNQLYPPLQVVSRFARWQYERLGEFLLVINVVAPERRASDEDVAAYRERLADILGMQVPSPHVYKSLTERMLWSAHTYGF